MPVVGIKFKKDGKIYNFLAKEELKLDDKVIVETERGKQLGIVASIENKSKTNNLKEIISTATEEDYARYLKNLHDAQKAQKETKELIKKYNLNMNIIDTNFSLDRKVLLFNFLSDERVDFRDLVKELASKYHTRIELHQVGVRDKAKEVGGIGLCGRKLCCNNHLNSVESVNINMVKNQNIALNPTKINGACGRLLCCFTYENETYEKERIGMPRIGDTIMIDGQSAKVIEIDILHRQYKAKIDNNTIVEVKVDDRAE